MLTAYYWISSASLHPLTSVTRSAGFANVFAWLVPGVPLRSTPGFTLSPRSAGLANVFAWLVPGVPLRSTPGFTLSPRSAGLANVFDGWFLGFCAPLQALRCRPLRGLCQCFCMAGPGVPLRSTPRLYAVARSRALQMFLHGWSWGSAALHPRLYAVARSAGFANLFAWRFLGFRCAPPQALRCHPLRGFKK